MHWHLVLLLPWLRIHTLSPVEAILWKVVLVRSHQELLDVDTWGDHSAERIVLLVLTTRASMHLTTSVVVHELVGWALGLVVAGHGL